jgi:hypothetical protein
MYLELHGADNLEASAEFAAALRKVRNHMEASFKLDSFDQF